VIPYFFFFFSFINFQFLMDSKSLWSCSFISSSFNCSYH
jgi:hypothetical protein